MKKRFMLLTVFLLLFCLIAPAHAQSPAGYDSPMIGSGGDAILADLIFVRPLSIVSLALGFVTSIAATPFAAASGTTPEVYEKLIVEPYNFTVCRPLGTGF